MSAGPCLPGSEEVTLEELGWAGQGAPTWQASCPPRQCPAQCPPACPRCPPLCSGGLTPPRPLSPAGSVPRPWSATAAVSQGEPVRVSLLPLAHTSWLGAQGCYCSSSPCPQVPHTPSWPFWGPGLCLPYLGVTRAESQGAGLGCFGGKSRCSSSRAVCRAVEGDSGCRPPQVSSKRENQFQAPGLRGPQGQGHPVPAPTSVPVRLRQQPHGDPFLLAASRPQVRPGPASGTRGARARGGAAALTQASVRILVAKVGRRSGLTHQSSPLLPEKPGWPQVLVRTCWGTWISRHTLLGFAEGSTVPGAAAALTGWRCCPWPLGMTTPSRGELNRRRHAGLGVLQSQAQWVPSSSPVRAPTLCEHSRDRVGDHPEAARWGGIGRLTGAEPRGCLVSRAQGRRLSVVLAWGPASGGVIMGFQQPDKRDGGGGAIRLPPNSECESCSVRPLGGPGVLRPLERNHGGRRGQAPTPPLPGPHLPDRACVCPSPLCGLLLPAGASGAAVHRALMGHASWCFSPGWSPGPGVWILEGPPLLPLPPQPEIAR